MKNLTVIIPIVVLDEEQVKLLKAAVESAKGAEKIIVVGDKTAIESAKGVEGVTFLTNDTGDITYPVQVNLAVNNVKTKYFSVLEYDDTFTPIWFKHAEKYASTDVEDIFAFFPLTIVKDAKTGEEIGFSNEPYWANSFSEVIGYMDMDSATEYFDFNVSGAIFQTEEFLKLGALKASMKLVFWYEFILRAIHKGKKIYVIPKVGCNHLVGREGCLSETYKKEMSDEETEWWVNLAKGEYFFPNDRNKVYEK